MRPAGRDGERRGHRDHVRVGLGQPREQRREAQIVADRQAELADRRAVHHDRAARRRDRSRIRASFRRSAGRRRTNGSCRSARGSCPARSMTKPRLATLPSSTRTASDPRCSQMPCSRAAARQAASTGSSSSTCRFAARALGIAVEQARHFGREQHRRAARRRLAIAPTSASALAARDRFRCSTGRARSGSSAAINSSSLPSPSSAIEIVASADMPVVDEDLRDGGPAVRALDHPLPLLRRRNRPTSRDTRRPCCRADASARQQ